MSTTIEVGGYPGVDFSLTQRQNQTHLLKADLQGDAVEAARHGLSRGYVTESDARSLADDAGA